MKWALQWKFFILVITRYFYAECYWACALVYNRTNTLLKIPRAELQSIVSLQSWWYSLQTLLKNTEVTTFTMDCSYYFKTFILPYWRHMQGCKLMWSISKSGPKLCQIKDPTWTQSQCRCQNSFLLALSLFWSCPMQSLLLVIFHSTISVAVKYAV